MSPPIRVLVAEDEMIISAKINMYLEEFGYEVAGALTRGEQVIEFCQHDLPDILMLDINLKGELDGIETAERLKQNFDLPIVYLTANSDSATFARARKTKPFAFLTKPFQKAELERTLALAVERLQPSADTRATASEEEAQILTDRIFLRERDQMVRVLLEDILFVQAERAYCRVYTATSRYTLSLAMGRLESQLPPKQFMRVHRSHLINVRHVSAFSEDSVTVGTHVLPVSRSYRSALVERLNLIR